MVGIGFRNLCDVLLFYLWVFLCIGFVFFSCGLVFLSGRRVKIIDGFGFIRGDFRGRGIFIVYI